ncbi:PR domain zinc finger protein 15 isoform X1 [Dendroctonus ponderosae]|uniref:PR domain zinc finger protein 15 isoform X1 n=1 Tax=Dendroctonus ponderosae TaxID=77166 RepID=UPI0020355600|nr:PR domain zinc finger protein 15 isoform X1 [Dendroctonus ponderosae]XP_019759666.2 PR domain zinc finger protein 15 isoform X1 [Dendroctonus ponderosae]KAH1024532.1 hypothetical protein HUJ05_003998 [Dendroctonus ponderosae]KAH1024533.1 hypothetical protein HUJ05_003998 [Dendroctonus ponderosae]
MELPDNSKEESDKGSVLPTKCGICGDPHFYRDCKYVIINTKVPDREVPSRAKQSLPDILEIRKLADESYSIFSKVMLEAGTEFGPFVAKKTLTLHPFAVFPIKVFHENESDLSEYYLDTVEENDCCWMMFVKPASDVEEQNLICYQENEDIFFGTIRDILPGEELKVWYSPYYAFKMQKNTLTFKESSQLQVETVECKPAADDLNTLIKAQQNIVPHVVWNCKFCYKLEKNVSDFAKHLLTHYAIKEKRTCLSCNNHFRYSTHFKHHIRFCRPEPTEKTPQPIFSKVAEKPQPEAKQQAKSNNIGGPLLAQCLNESLNNSDSLLPQSDPPFFEMENYENPDLLFGSELLGINIDLQNGAKDVHKKYFVCDICLKKFPNVKGISNHLKLHIGNYFCPECKKIFGRPESFKYHKCNRVYSLKCPKCERIFYQKKYLLKHISVFHEKKHACPSCQKLCFSSTELKNHYCRKLPKEKRKVLKCAACPKMFFSEMGLRKHKKNHLSDGISTTYICSECSETFSSKLIYQRHVHTIHNKSRQYECKICDKVFYRGDALKMHLTNIHMQGKAEGLQCPSCNRKFKSNKYLQDHMKSFHDNSKYKCNLCTHSFKYSRNLSRHLKMVHGKEELFEDAYECPTCKIKVKLKSSLRRHLRTKHPEKFSSSRMKINSSQVEVQELKFKCPICDLKVKLKSSLHRHILKKHPDDYKNVCGQVKEKDRVTGNSKKRKQIDDEFDKLMDLQKTIENMDFNIDTCNENLLSGNETIDKFLKESSDQISIFFADSPKPIPIVNEISTVITERATNREVGLSMPDLLELEHEIKAAKQAVVSPAASKTFDPLLALNSSDVVLYALNNKPD